ncbi:hypothetical protein PR202_ga31278 [Eleusine coracana subsp. coracana]|uniref:Uncharacterized protein n=1 Tax=Eleusine coracana subsp. coracana TaxID=191504 RepID=A0AAV5DRL3_ELECO|nr:hypothetical protein PR202_ga31278 [Eleusine coracana subsp. coracana]
MPPPVTHSRTRQGSPDPTGTPAPSRAVSQRRCPAERRPQAPRARIILVAVTAGVAAQLRCTAGRIQPYGGPGAIHPRPRRSGDPSPGCGVTQAPPRFLAPRPNPSRSIHEAPPRFLIVARGTAPPALAAPSTRARCDSSSSSQERESQPRRHPPGPATVPWCWLILKVEIWESICAAIRVSLEHEQPHPRL